MTWAENDAGLLAHDRRTMSWRKDKMGAEEGVGEERIILDGDSKRRREIKIYLNNQHLFTDPMAACSTPAVIVSLNLPWVDQRYIRIRTRRKKPNISLYPVD